jgi:hypothetical protein
MIPTVPRSYLRENLYAVALWGVRLYSAGKRDYKMWNLLAHPAGIEPATLGFGELFY